MFNHTLSNGQEVWLNVFTGVVIQEKRQTVTEVHQTAATRHYNPGTKDSPGSYSWEPGEVYSTSRLVHEVWLRNKKGVEELFDIGAFSVPVRMGHCVSVMSGGGSGREGYYFAARNHTSGKTNSSIWDRGPSVRGSWGFKVFWSCLPWLAGGVIALLAGVVIKHITDLWGFALTFSLPVAGVLVGVGVRLAPVKKMKALATEVEQIAAARLKALDNTEATTFAVPAGPAGDANPA